MAAQLLDFADTIPGMPAKTPSVSASHQDAEILYINKAGGQSGDAPANNQPLVAEVCRR
jgi:hypothetical protein